MSDLARFTKLQKQQLEEIEILVHDVQYDEGVTDENIRKLAIKHGTLKSYLTKVRRRYTHPDDMLYVEELNLKVWSVLCPIYDQLTDLAVDHCHQFFKRVKKEAGALDPELYDYQLDLIKYFLEACIKNELPESILTLLVSRGAGRDLPLNS
ncbi:MAG: hypothetical protein ACRC6E_08310 [Fusobacteriaceae bacterium]